MKIKPSPRRMKFGHSATEVGLASKMPRPPRRQEKTEKKKAIRTTRANTLRIACPECNAPAGTGCENRHGASHAERHEAYVAALGSKIPAEPPKVSNTPEVYWESNPERCPVCKVWDECYCAENRELSLYCLTCGEDIIGGICACGDLPGSRAPEPKVDPYADMSTEELEADLRRKLGMDDWTGTVKHIFSGK